MLDYFLLLFGCTLIAGTVSSPLPTPEFLEDIRSTRRYRWIFRIIIIFFVLFAGLRTTYNDTVTYIQGYHQLSSSMPPLSTILTSYGGFIYCEKLFRHLFGYNAQPFLMFVSILTNVLFINFISKHTESPMESVFRYGYGLFMFSMAGMKQAISMSIALYAIDAYFERRYIKAALILLIAMTFHPYVICFLVVPFSTNRSYSWKTFGICVLVFIAFLNLGLVFEALSMIGKDYSSEDLDSYTINPIRVLVEAVPVVLMLINRNKINESGDRLVILYSNMAVISFLFIFVGLFINPIYPGRMATYFSILSCVVTPKMLDICFEDNPSRRTYKFLYYAFFFAYFLFDLTKLGTIPLFYDRFKHASISSLFK